MLNTRLSVRFSEHKTEHPVIGSDYYLTHYNKLQAFYYLCVHKDRSIVT